MDERADLLERGWDSLERGEIREARRAAASLLGRAPEDVEALVLEATALLEEGLHAESEGRLRRALAIDPSDRAAGLTLASLLYETCRFEEGLAAARAPAEADPDDPWTQHLLGLLLDMTGRRLEADAAFGRAAALDPQGYPRSPSLDRRQLDVVVEEALGGLPREFRDRLDNLSIQVEEVPSAAHLESLEEAAPDLLGLFVGTPLPERSTAAPASLPDAIFLFKRNLERACASRAELVEEIRVTLLHEIGHYLGMTEDDLEAAGYD